jgi:hypothetical protein
MAAGQPKMVAEAKMKGGVERIRGTSFFCCCSDRELSINMPLAGGQLMARWLMNETNGFWC